MTNNERQLESRIDHREKRYSAAVGNIELWDRFSSHLGELTVVISESEDRWLDLPVKDIPELIMHLQAIHEMHRGSW